MALKKNLILKAGTVVNSLKLITNPNIEFRQVVLKQDIEVPGAYIKITDFSGDKNLISFSVETFEDNTKTNKLFEKSYQFIPEMTDKNFIEQAYDYLKTLPEFDNAEDC